jgi:hypothetical protein
VGLLAPLALGCSVGLVLFDRGRCDAAGELVDHL